MSTTIPADALRCACGCQYLRRYVLDVVSFTGWLDAYGSWHTDLDASRQVEGGHDDDTPLTRCAACGVEL